MTLSDQILQKEIGWNGIRFRVPRDWEVGKIGTHYLLLEDEFTPVMEIKWGQIKGSFSHDTHLRRLSTLRKKRFVESVSKIPLPSGWKKALANFKATGFSWRGTALGGVGVILYCRTCQKASLIQFYHDDAGELKSIYPIILASYNDHPQDEQVIWSVFDIRALIPRQFQLLRHQLNPGRFELSFESKGQQITLYRWGPASVLLDHQSLAEFARTMINFSEDGQNTVIQSDRRVVEWKTSAPFSMWKRGLWRMRNKHPFQQCRIWHSRGKNRILGVKAYGKKPLDSRLLKSIFNGYESL